MKKQWKGFITGMLVMALTVGLIGTASATVGRRTVEVDYNDIKVTMNGTPVNLVDANGNPVEPFLIDGTTYLPVRAVSNALGLDVGWDQATATVQLSDGGSQANTGSGFLGISDALETEHFLFTIQSAKNTTSFTNDLGLEYKAADGKTFLILTINAKNITEKTHNVDNLFNAYVDGYKTNNYTVIGTYKENMILIGAVSAGMNFTGYSVWELPENWETFQFSYIDDYTGSESIPYIISSKDIV